jgi:hypothetical protein
VKRREFVGAGIASSATAAAGVPLLQTAVAGTRPALKITDIKTYLVGAG